MSDTPKPGYGYILCDKYDESEDKEYFCQCDSRERWRLYSFDGPPFEGEDCGKFWRKPVPIPDGWELVPEGEMETEDMKYWSHRAAEWKSNKVYGMNHAVEWYSKVDTYIGAFIRPKQPAQPAQPSQPSGWVSVKERLPERGGFDENIVLVLTDWGRVCAGYHDGTKWNLQSWTGSHSHEAAYWMPLPPLPKPTAPEKSESEIAFEAAMDNINNTKFASERERDMAIFNAALKLKA